MNLVEYQRTVLRVCFDAEASPSDLESLGGSAVWTDVYRPMVRRRLRNMAKTAYGRALGEVGDAGFDASFSRFLVERPPASGLIREVIAAYGTFAQADTELLSGTAPHVAELFAFEQAKWEIGYVPGHYPAVGEQGVRDFDFQGEVVLNPTLRLLHFRHNVQTPAADGGCVAGETRLLVYRPPEVDAARWFAVDHFPAVLFERWLGGAPAVADGIRAAATASGRAVDESLLGELSNVLTLAVQRGVVIGAR